MHFCHHAFEELPALSRASRGGLAYRLNAGLARAISRLAERWCYRSGRAERLVGVSEGVARELRRFFPAMSERILVIPNGVDTDEFRPAGDSDRSPEDRREGEGLEALFVGSEWERKGLKVALEALRDNPDIGLTVVGDGDEHAYRELAEGLGVADRVTFAGTTADVAPWYRRADVFVLPSAYETFSLVTYEAAASGLPLLVTRVNGVEDILRDDVNGWFIDRDPDTLRRRLRSLRDEPRLREKLGAAARESSLEYSWSRVVEQYEELYRGHAR